jgi:RNA polymerase sigma-70 factor (ECF subfamily)
MEPARNPIALEALLAEASWVRSLAERLVRDRAEAEDVVQETWLAALRSPAPEDGRLRPWLARVVLNFARRTRRGHARRTRREEHAARIERVPAASESLERLEIQRLLVDAIESLDEPYRMTVILRHLDGISAEEIARREGIPASTVRWRLKKGIDELRVRLDRRFGGDRGAWAIALVPLAHEPSLGALTKGGASAVLRAALQGGMAMNAMTKVGLALAVVLAASVGVWVSVDGRASEPAIEAANAAPGLDAPTRSHQPDSSDALAIPSATETAVPARTALAKEPEPVVARPSTNARLEVRFVDRFARPIARVEMRLPAFDPFTAPPSGVDGRIAVDIELPRSEVTIGLVAARSDFATHFGEVTLRRGVTAYLGDIELGPGGSVAGRVLAPDGRPARDAEVKVSSPELASDTDEARVRGPSERAVFPSVVTDEEGVFRIDGVRAGFVRVWACGKDTRWAATAPLEVFEATTHDGIEIQLEPLETADTIDGIVLSPNGDPVPDASVRYQGQAAGGTWSGNFSAGSDGRFRHRVPVRGAHDFSARDTAGRWPDASVQDVEPGTHDLVLQFPPERWLDLIVRAKAGALIDEFAVTVFSADGVRTLTPGKLETHAEGRARILVPGEPFKLDVRARGRGGVELGPWSPTDAPPSIACSLERRAGVRGRVTHAGEPVVGARVALHEMSDDTTRIEHNGFPTRLHPLPEDETTSDGDGWFELDPDRPDTAEGQRFFQHERGSRGVFAIVCESIGLARAEISPLDIDPAVGIDGVEIALTNGGAIEGRVLTAKGKDPAGVIVAIDRTDGEPLTTRVGPDGSFRFDHLTPGEWNVTRAEQEVQAGAWSTSWNRGEEARASYPTNCSVYERETTRFDLDLTDDRPCILRAQLTVNGAPAAGWTAKLNPKQGGTGRTSPGGAVDGTGALNIEAAEPGEYELALSPPVSTDVSFTRITVLQRGDNVVPIELRTGSVRGRLANLAEDAAVQYECATPGSVRVVCNAWIKPASDGTFELPIVMAGHARVSRMQIRPNGGTVGPIAEIAVDVGAGAAVEVIVP